MADQLNILGLWERTPPGEVAPPTREVIAPPLVVDPRQQELLEGAHTLRAKIEDACLALDAPSVAVAHAELIASGVGHAWAASVPRWAETISWLVEAPTADEQAERAMSLSREEHLPGISVALCEGVRSTALKKAGLRLIGERGPAAALSDGRPAGYLLLVAGDFSRARALLSSACETTGHSNGAWLGYLGEATWALGDSFAALQAYCRASLVDPERVDQAWLKCQPVLDLLDLGDELELEDSFSHLAVLADLSGKQPLAEVSASAASRLPVRLAALLRAYRRGRASGELDEAGRLAAKRELARLAPAGLRELIRRL